jgi:hypothetical protein
MPVAGPLAELLKSMLVVTNWTGFTYASCVCWMTVEDVIVFADFVIL